MFEKIVRAAEKAADGVSRRAFLGGLGKAALGAAAALGAVLAFPGVAPAQAAGSVYCCIQPKGPKSGPGGCRPSCQWLCPGGYSYSACSIFKLNGKYIGTCPIPPVGGCVLVNNCTCPPQGLNG
jgi:hypothetical protein